ncbi:hypothetical protein QZH41_016432 [Actinostola sp. cb2023]|nr:hypothetical protein QZH41_016432 [Actinostola sp. cb2023]
MGMPDSETALEELMWRVLGELLQRGVVAKIADDFYCGGNNPTELLENWGMVLKALYRCDLRLSASKTVINPKSTTILGCASLLAPLEDAIAGRQSSNPINWTEKLRKDFTTAQTFLSSNRTIMTLPKPNDQLWIVTDGAVRKPRIGATLYITREGKLADPSRQSIVVPRQVLEGLLTVLHIKLDHPSSHQLRSAANRYFFALDMDKAIDHVANSCHPCVALKKTPKSLIEESTNPPPDAVGTTFAADVIKRTRQLILLSDVCNDTLRDALIHLCLEMRPLDGPPAVIRTDPALTRLQSPY